MDTDVELKRMCEGLELRLASMNDGEYERQYTVYKEPDNNEIGTLMISTEADSEDIIQSLIEVGYLKSDGDYSNVYGGKDDEIDIDETVGDDTNTCMSLKTFEEIEDFDEFMQNVLDIERTQYSTGSGWETKDYTVVVGTGGPHIEFTTDYHIRAYWGSGKLDYYVGDDNARSTIDHVYDYLNDLYYE